MQGFGLKRREKQLHDTFRFGLDENPITRARLPPSRIWYCPERARGLKQTQRQKLLKMSRKTKCSQKIFQQISQKIDDITFYTVFKSISGYLRNLRGRLLSSEKLSEVFALWVFICILFGHQKKSKEPSPAHLSAAPRPPFMGNHMSTASLCEQGKDRDAPLISETPQKRDTFRARPENG